MPIDHGMVASPGRCNCRAKRLRGGVAPRRDVQNASREKEGAMATPFILIDGQSVTLLGWRSLTPINLAVLGGLIGATLLGLGLGLWRGGSWWYLCGGAGVVLAYALWATFESAKTKIRFGDGSLSINGERIDAAGHGPFYFTTDTREEFGDGIDDQPGANILWLESQLGEPVFLTLMSLHADTDAIGRCLNDFLDQSKAAKN